MRPVIFAPQEQRASGANARLLGLSQGISELVDKSAFAGGFSKPTGAMTVVDHAGSKLAAIGRWLSKTIVPEYDDTSLFVGGVTFGSDATSLTCMGDVANYDSSTGHYALGVSFQPSSCSRYERSARRFLNSCSFVGVRDDISYQVVRDLAPETPVERTFDLMPMMLGMSGVSLNQLERRGIAVCVSGNMSSYLMENLRASQRLATVLNRIAKESGEPIYFIDFCSDGLNEDRVAHRTLAAQLCTSVESHFIAYNANAQAVLSMMSQFRLCLSQRVDALSMAFLAGTPCFQLWPLDEYSVWLEGLGLPEQYAEDLRYGSLDIAMHRMLDGLQYGFLEPSVSLDHAYDRAMSNWMLWYPQLSEHFSQAG